jgi:dipeptidyl aminopeptidase/acylaminoacyl peptidase
MTRTKSVYILAVLGTALIAADAPSPISRPAVSEQVSPLQVIHPQAADGHKTVAVLRKPPGDGPFPAIIDLHGGLVEVALDPPSRGLGGETLRQSAGGVTISRFLAAGYVTVVTTFRSRERDPQSRDALEDCKAVIAYVKRLPEVDPKSVVIWGTSGGGSLALELAGELPLAAVVAEEPASILFTGVFNSSTPKRGALYEVADANGVTRDPHRYYTPELQRLTRTKIQKISCPIFVAEGGVHPINRINNEIILPELKKAGKNFQGILYPGEGHGFSRGSSSPEAAKKFFDDALAFFARYLNTQPKAIETSLLTNVPVKPRSRL